ncbi:hypothetical protein [uncultured Sphingomonas sp.]|uniref:FliH/SctL family protein n=1 Tax=uncultured Sphingomonas sp. TaxID=158754 RepID=UPI0025F28F99|nr:hypothetical protein [uncultured Sphingomonas sp.]
MSDGAAAFADMARVPVWTRPSARTFAPRGVGDPTGFSRWSTGETEEAPLPYAAAAPAPAAQPAVDVEALMAQGYAEGLEEGRRLALAELEHEQVALAHLASSLQALNPGGADGLAAVLSASVLRLVTQIVGEVEVNPDTLAERCHSVAATIAEETTPSRLRLHPTDIVRLSGATFAVEMVGDPLLAPGSVVLDTGAGWVEDGPHVRLERLRAALDRLGAPK